MSEENVETMRRSVVAVERRDKDAWREFCHAEIEAVPVGDWPEGEIRGHDDAWDFLIAVDELWEPGRWELNEVTDGGDNVAARMQRTCAASPVESKSNTTIGSFSAFATEGSPALSGSRIARRHWKPPGYRSNASDEKQ
jgi:ketosteroid isomerase-like protein